MANKLRELLEDTVKVTIRFHNTEAKGNFEKAIEESFLDGKARRVEGVQSNVR